MLVQNISYYNHNPQFTAIKPRKIVPNLRQPNIDNCEFGTLPEETQNIIKHLQNTYAKINTYFDKLKTKPTKASQIRQRYESLIRRNNSQGLTFINPETDEYVTILKSRSSNKLLRFIIEGKDSSKHLLVDTPDKLVKNIDPNAPYVIPPKFRYMTNAEIQNSGISGYAKFADEETQKYNQYLENYDELYPRQKPGSKIGSKRISNKITPQEVKTYEIKDILKIFNQDSKSLPSHINTIISPRTGQLLGFNLITSDGNTLRVSKNFLPEYGNKLLFISFTEIDKTGSKKFINIDINTREFLQSANNGKPLIEDDILYTYTPDEVEENGILKRFNSYMNEIFNPQNTKSSTEHKTTVAKMKQQTSTKKTPSIDEIKVEDIEDKRLNKLLDKNKNSILD